MDDEMKANRPNCNWICWNKETKSIMDIGTRQEMEETSDWRNKHYQTNAYVAREIKD